MKLELHGVSKRFGSHQVLHEVALQAEFDHCLALIGPSGGGKSTVLRCLAGLEIPDTGVIRIDGELLPREEEKLRTYRRSLGIVFQSFNLFPHLNALENVMLPLIQVHGLRRSAAEEKAMAVMRRFGLSDHARKNPYALSGGQKQRVAIARAVAVDPRIFIMDEPTSALDPEMTAEVLDLILELKAGGTPLILVTHEMGFARTCADVIAFVHNGEIAETGPAVTFFQEPGTDVARRFLSQILRY